jgi:hypothetical protein
MSWTQTGKPQVVRITAKLAKEFVEMEAAPGDRALSERRLQVYRKVRSEGGFRPVTWAKVWCTETGQWYRVNGKHTSTLFSDGESLDGLYAVVEQYECETLDDVARLYATFDSGVQMRNVADINRTFAKTVPELKDLKDRLINTLVSAMNYNPEWEKGTSYTRSPVERAEVLFDNVGVCLWVQEVIGEHRSPQTQHLWRAPVAAAMIACYKKSQRAATEFWTAVRDETGTKPDLPDRKLAKFLSVTRSVLGPGSPRVPNRFKISEREYYVKSIHAWNAWRKDETTNLNYYANAKSPLAQ